MATAAARPEGYDDLAGGWHQDDWRSIGADPTDILTHRQAIEMLHDN